MLTIQFGQCGNQLGHALFSKISSDIECVNTGVPYAANYRYSEDTFNKWFNGISKHGKRLARTILVDTEQKVINKICNDTTMPWTYCTRNVICQAGGGCANNWAYGYMVKGQELSDVVLNNVRLEIESLDQFDGLLLLMSSAGGTGSGIGSYISELLRNEYSTKSILGAAVLPFSFGEVCTQNYNTLLSLSKLCNQTDGMILFENEQMYAMCRNLLQKHSTSLQDINEIIAEKLMAIFQPVDSLRYTTNRFISQVVPHPAYKLVTVKSTPHISKISSEYEPLYNWKCYIHHLRQMLRTSLCANSELTNAEARMPSALQCNTAHHIYAYSVSNLLITRGPTTEADVISTNDLQEQSLYANWIMSNAFHHLHQTRKLLNKDRFLALVTNNSHISEPLDALLNKAWNSYIHAAFLHQYKQFGLEEDDFLQGFATIENIAKEYKDLVCGKP